MKDMKSEYMERALYYAKSAFENGEIPVGAVIVKDDRIIAAGENHREGKNNALSHAEIEAINNACKTLGSWRLDGCTMYVTLEPCMMCMGAIINSRIDTLVFGAYDLKAGCADSLLNAKGLLSSEKPEIYGGIMEEKCKKILKEFFDTARSKAKQKSEFS